MQVIDVLYSGYSFQHESLVYDTERGRIGFESYHMLFTHTPALFWVDNELRQYPAKSVILFTPGHRKYYSSLPGEPYKNDWIRFDTDEEFIETFPITNVPFSPADPDFVHNLFIIALPCEYQYLLLIHDLLNNVKKRTLIIENILLDDEDESVNQLGEIYQLENEDINYDGSFQSFSKNNSIMTNISSVIDWKGKNDFGYSYFENKLTEGKNKRREINYERLKKINNKNNIICLFDLFDKLSI